MIHTCFNKSDAVGLAFGSICNAAARNSLASVEMLFHVSAVNATFLSCTCCIWLTYIQNGWFIACSSSSLSSKSMKGGSPLSRMYTITPRDHISHLESYGLPENTSGAQYPWVPSAWVSPPSLPSSVANPKSEILIGESSSKEQYKMFSGFKSLCTMPLLCIYTSALSICLARTAASFSERCFFSKIRSNISPPYATSWTIYMKSVVSK
mmetsp:Transcript_29183/g.40591  ORF Transcript_29183/g.40591 Transcript_29183/m.40591 type:complete len:209 (-) Transcript_29183:1244-1870(-)